MSIVTHADASNVKRTILPTSPNILGLPSVTLVSSEGSCTNQTTPSQNHRQTNCRSPETCKKIGEHLNSLRFSSTARSIPELTARPESDSNTESAIREEDGKRGREARGVKEDAVNYRLLQLYVWQHD